MSVGAGLKGETKPFSSPWYVYMIKTKCNTLYTGITTDVTRRFDEHVECFKGLSNKGAKYFRGREPKAVVYQEVCENRSRASQREYQIKKMSAPKKRALINVDYC